MNIEIISKNKFYGPIIVRVKLEKLANFEYIIRKSKERT